MKMKIQYPPQPSSRQLALFCLLELLQGKLIALQSCQFRFCKPIPPSGHTKAWTLMGPLTFHRAKLVVVLLLLFYQ